MKFKFLRDVVVIVSSIPINPLYILHLEKTLPFSWAVQATGRDPLLTRLALSPIFPSR